METPSSCMFGDLRAFGGLTNRDSALILLSDSVTFGGETPRARINERTFLSRQIVHAMPGQTPASFFADFFHSSQKIRGAIAARLRDEGDPHVKIVEHYSGPAADRMRQVLDQLDLEGAIYSNAVSRILAAGLRSEADRATLLVMLFVSTGCLGDPRAAVDVVDRFVTYKLALDVNTVEMDLGENCPELLEPEPDDEGLELGLLRVAGDVVRPPIYPLSCDPEGTVIGALADGKNVINDVDVDVSREHLRIWREHGTWLAQDLGSTNGSELISGADGSTTVIAEPRTLREEPSLPAAAVAIESGDKIRLGSTTVFLVLRIAS